MTRTPGRGVQSIEVGGRLLRLLAEAERPLMLRELADRADLTSGQAHAYLLSFRQLELVEQDPGTGRYRLGPFALMLGIARARQSEALRTVWDSVPAFADAMDAMVTLSLWTDAGPVVVRLYEAAQQLYSNIRAGARYSLPYTATGRLFAALLPARVCEPIVAADLKRSGGGAVETRIREGLRRDIARIRRERCAITEGRPVPDLSAVAVPVFDSNDQLIAAITVIGRRDAIECRRNGRHRRAALEFAQVLSARLGYRGGAGWPQSPDRAAGATHA